MAITYTYSWDQPFSESTDQRDATLTAHVVRDDGVLTGFNIASAVHAQTGAAFPRLGDPLPNDTRYVLNRRSSARFDGPSYAKVSLFYRRGPFGGSEATDDPLAAPIRYRFRPITNSEPTDQDADLNPLINSAGDPFGSVVQGPFNSYVIEAKRNEVGFNVQLATSLQNTVNRQGVSIAGNNIPAGGALCTGIYPQNDYTLTDPYVTVVYEFEVRERLFLFGGERVTAFCHRLLDQGQRGFIASEKKVPIYDRNGEIPNPTPVTSDVPLDRGQPLTGDKNYWSVDTGFDPANGRSWEINSQIDAGAILAVDQNPDTKITFLYYRKYREESHAGLGL